MTTPAGLRRPVGRTPTRRDVVVALAVTALQVVAPRTGPATEDPSAAVAVLGLLLLLAQGVPIAWRRVAPVAVLAVVGVAFVLYALVVEPVPPYAGWVALASLAVRRNARTTAVATAALVGGVLVGYLSAYGSSDEWVMIAVVTAGVAVTAQLVRERRARLDAVAERAAAEERLRIARDLHDVLGHSLSGIAVQSSTGRMALESDRPDLAEDALRRIEEASRSSMAEVRALLSSLRDTSAPGLESLDSLTGEAASDGSFRVTVQRHGDLSSVPADIGRAAFRVVQEAVTNARRHAAPCAVEVEVRAGADSVDVDVRDDGQRVATTDPPVAGHGLAGMRERVESLGGRVEAGPASDGGWRVHAVLPHDAGAGGAR